MTDDENKGCWTHKVLLDLQREYVSGVRAVLEKHSPDELTSIAPSSSSATVTLGRLNGVEAPEGHVWCVDIEVSLDKITEDEDDDE